MKKLIAIMVAGVVLLLPAFASKRFYAEQMQIASDSFLNFTNAVTIALWMHRLNSPGVSIQGIVTKGRTDVSQPALYLFYFDADKLKFAFANPDGTYYTWTTTSAYSMTNRPIHLACTFTHGLTNSMRIYLNGLSLPGSWDTGLAATNAIVNANNFIAGLLNTAATAPTARFSDLGVWNIPLSDSQIISLVNGPKRTGLQFSEGLVSFYPFDDGPDNLANTRTTIDYTPTHRHSALLAGGFNFADGFVGYPPNE